jgi:hypothetical protein
LNVVNELCLDVGVVGICVSDSTHELDVGKELARVALSQLKVPEHKVSIEDILHGHCGCWRIGDTLNLICVIDFQDQVDGLGIEGCLDNVTC